MGRRKDGETEAEEGETEREPEKVSGGTETGRERWGGERDQGVSEISDLRGDKTKLSLCSDAFPTGPWSCVWPDQHSLSKDPVVIPTLISANPHCLILLLFPPSQVVCNILGLSFVRSSALEVFSVQFSSVAKSCPTLCDPMNSITPGLPVHHQLSKLP